MEISDTKIFDFVIVGGGSAGCVVAARLSQNPRNTVLLVEAGEDFEPGTEPFEIRDTFAGSAHSSPRFTWREQKVFWPPRPSNSPDDRKSVRYAQGRVIGGGSSVNGMISIRGLPSDYDGWREAGAIGWGWSDVLPFFKKQETDRDFDGPLHGQDGPMALQRIFENDWPGFTRAFIDGARAQGWTDLQDKNANFGDGFFPVAVAHNNGMRTSTATAYLTKEVRKRKNLSIIAETHVKKVIFTGTKVSGVCVIQNGKEMDIKAKEIIISSGALHTPALLLRSGIGPAEELYQYGIDVIADRSGVGKHLMEHPGVNFGCYMRPDFRLPDHLRLPMYAGLRWSSHIEGCPPGDMYLIPMNKSFWHAIGERIGLIMLWVNKSYSTGQVKLNPFDHMATPIVDFNLVSDERDMERLKLGTRMMIKFSKQPEVQASASEIFPISYSDRARRYAVYNRINQLQTWVGGQVMDFSSSIRRLLINKLIADNLSINDIEEDENIMEAWIKKTVLGHYHASCSCHMGRPNDEMAVTDHCARVYGVEGLRIADASIMPSVPCANTNFPTIMVAERVSSLILEESAP